jgi:hypothetical protein
MLIRIAVSLFSRLTLRNESGRYYITFQEDFYHPDVSKSRFLFGVRGVMFMSWHNSDAGLLRNDNTAARRTRRFRFACRGLCLRIVCAHCTSDFRRMEASSESYNSLSH